MTTVDEAREALLTTGGWQTRDERRARADALIAAVRAESAETIRSLEERMAGYMLDATADRETLAALREVEDAARYVVQLANQPGLDDDEFEDAITGLERALAATPAEDEEGRT